MIPEPRLAEMRQAIATYGSANCWTGTTGTLAAMIFELLKERAELLESREDAGYEALERAERRDMANDE